MASESPMLVVTINGVTPSMRLADLTVSQFLELLSQVSAQLASVRRLPDPQDMEDALAEVSKAIANMKQDVGAGEQVQRTRQAVTTRSPAALGMPARDGGLSPAATQAAVNPVLPTPSGGIIK